ncbi:MAG TPA: energy transducer TonB, partial [Bacteroidia bacterium]|nr:energy transducer TonB [Bacteroidia bacterium]
MKTFIAVSAIYLGVSLIACTDSGKEKNPSTPVAEAKEISPSANVPDTVNEVTATSIPVSAPIEEKDFAAEKKSPDDVNEIYRHLDVKPQQFSFDDVKDSEIVCTKGTKLKFKNNSFIDAETGREVTGKVNVTVKEYFDMPEIIAANLSTTSHGEMLETAGMIYVDASVNGRQCKLKEGSKVEITFPQERMKDGMQLFTGQRKNFESIDWIPVNVPVKSEGATVIWGGDQVDKAPVFPGGRDELYSFLKRELKKNNINLNNRSVRNIDVTLRIDADGSVEKAEISKAANKDLNKAIVSAMKKMPSWTPAEKDGKKVKVFYRITLTFIGSDLFIGNSKFSPEVWAAGRNVFFDLPSRLDKEEFETNMTDSMVQTTDVEKVRAY